MAQTANFFAPGFDEQVEQQNIERQRKYAELLRQQATAPMDNGQMVGGRFVAPSFTQGLAKMLQSYYAGQGMTQADEKQKQLADAVRNRTTSEMGQFTDLLTGRKADVLPPDQQGPVRPEQAPDLGAAYQFAAKAQTPALQQFGVQGALTQATEQAKLAQAKALQEQQLKLWTQANGNPQTFMQLGGDPKLAKEFAEAPMWGKKRVVINGQLVDEADASPVGAPIPKQAEPSNPARDKLIPDGKGGWMPNPAMVEYEQKTAPLKAPKVTVSMTDGQKGFENETSLGKSFRSEPIYKDYNDMRAAYGQVKAGLNQGTPIGDVAGATKIMKLLDPGSVVRESELGIAMEAAGKVDRLKNYFDMWQSGKKLTPEQRTEFAALADELYDVAGQVYNKTRAVYADQGKRYGLNTDILGPEHSMPKPAAPKSDKRPPLASFNKG